MPVIDSLTALFGEPFTRAATLFGAGGPVVVVLVGMSVVALATVVVKLWQFHRAGLWRRAHVKRMIDRLEPGALPTARDGPDRSRHPAAHLLRLTRDERATGLSNAKLREILQQRGTEMLDSLRGGLRTLEVIGALAPLLGLLGTVMGMIEAFRALETAGSRVDPAVLSGGIWQALSTTAVGLGVAIPVIMALNLFERALERLATDMGAVATRALVYHDPACTRSESGEDETIQENVIHGARLRPKRRIAG